MPPRTFNVEPPNPAKVTLILRCAAKLAQVCTSLGYDLAPVVATSYPSTPELVAAIADALPVSHKKVAPTLRRALAILLLSNADMTRLERHPKQLESAITNTAKNLTDRSDLLLGAAGIALITRGIVTMLDCTWDRPNESE